MKLIFSLIGAVVYLTGGVLSAGGILTDEDKEALLNVHNDKRSATALGNTGTQPMATNMVKLVWDQDLANTAKTWADNCEFAHDYSGYGENLYLAFSTIDNIDNREKLVSGVGAWYVEYSYYNYDGNTCSSRVCGHYTQTVWANTKRVGCAYAANCGINNSYNYDVLLVCRYDPPGNYVGHLPYEEATTSDDIASNCPTGYVSEEASGLCIESSNATPAPTPDPTTAPTPTGGDWETIYQDDFELGQGKFLSTSKRFDRVSYPDGEWSLLFNKFGELKTEWFDISGYSQVSFKFWMYAKNLIVGDNFFFNVRFNGEQTFTHVEEYVCGTDFVNKQWVEKTMVIDVPAGDDSIELQFKGNNRKGNKLVYIDQVLLEGK